ncbi:auxin-responsive protein IAA33 [Amborella trichopoda]|uniref:Auxin-responsive protein n=1 Tax=Amborella trichopoda TaxID=13333 RepID=W1PHX5_AMBTC|nr:auxin-responsive protein IAA33 [Amborella trichopoda]ERN07314.1 hypothetical protein AMTR_s00019p00222170 [Amborella trichopoda]|eukprot:XP_006845639.1 auxin-responsive protein IAA33 [Amborella trichopoda]
MADFNAHQQSCTRPWPENSNANSTFYARILAANPDISGSRNSPTISQNAEISANMMPSVTVVLEGRAICQRISLQKHGSYQSLAKALRQMFLDISGDYSLEKSPENDCDLSNAIPGYFIAYEDMEDDLLLAGDLNWKDFVRVAKRIRILPVKAKQKAYGSL